MARRKKQKIYKELQVEKLAAEGKCLARTEDDKVVFIENTLPGDVVDVFIKKSRKSYMEGRPVLFHEYSDLRIDPFCEHFGVCGGCKWQHLEYQKQIAFKEEQIVDQFQRIGKFHFPTPEPIMAAPKTTFYRNKLEYTFSDKRWLTKEEIEESGDITQSYGLGFHIPGMFDKVVDINKCWLQDDRQNAIRNEIRDFTLARDYEYYNLRDHQGQLRNLIIRNSNLDQWMIILQTAKYDEKIDQLLDHLIAKFPFLSSVYYILNQKMNDSYGDLEPTHYYGKEYIEEQMEDLTFRVGPKSFLQTNSEQSLAMYRKVRDLAGLTGNEWVYDLYTGTGTIANFLAKKALGVIGVEYVAEAIEDAKKNSAANGITNTKFFAGDMREVLTIPFAEKHGRPDVVITDPPRAGMHPDVIKCLLELAPTKIVYVSCNPATQARDIAALDELYAVKVVQPLDMFPHTHHLENIVLLEKR